ncbi:MAG: SAM-dependent methyltransferase [Burkholderiales bacterium]
MLERGGHIVRVLCSFFFAFVIAAAAAAQAPDVSYQPRMGQPGKDVVWIPSPDGMVEKMLDMAHVRPQDFVIDLGSGDGRNVIAAAKRGARALGVEYNPELVELSKRAAAAAGVGDRAEFVQGDMFAVDISKATALVLFLIPGNLEKLAPKFLALEPGTRIVSNTYEIGGGWQPDETDRLQFCRSWCTAHLYVVPAKVAGTWRLPSGELTLTQEFQWITGTYEQSGISLPVENGLLRGNEIRFIVNGVEYAGNVNGDAMEGVAKGRAATTQWTARRVSD